MIGEAARLLGVTPKAIRHYEKLGLLGEPERSEGGYRLYAARDLLKLSRVKKLQSFGLSLGRIKEVLAEEESEENLKPVLEALLGEVEARIAALEERRERLREALRKGSIEDETGEPYALRFAGEYLGEEFAELPPEIVEQVRKLWANLDSFEWPEGYGRSLELLYRHYARTSPEARRKALDLEKRFLDLRDVPEDSPEVERLVEDYFAHEEKHPLPEELEKAGIPGAAGEVFAEVFLSNFSPTQRRFVRLMMERWQAPK